MTHPRAITLELKTSTALFSHGSDSRRNAEIRTPPFEALARYFFRALVGDHHSPPCRDQEADCPCLRCEEGRVFGSADQGKGVAFVLENKKAAVGRASLLPHQANSIQNSCVQKDQRMTLHIIPALPTTSDKTVQAATASLVVGLLLGGIGQRSRRGAGSSRIESIQGGNGLDIIKLNQATSLRDYASALEAILKTAKAQMLAPARRPEKRNITSSAAFPILAPNHARILLANVSAKNESDARAEVMRWLRPFKNACFGLPYMKTAPGEHQEGGRHASPLWIHLSPYQNGWRGTFTVLKSTTLAGNPKKLDEFLVHLTTKRSAIPITPP